MAVTRDRSVMDPTRANREIYDLLRDGYLANWRDETGEERAERVRYLDWHDSEKNDWLAAPRCGSPGTSIGVGPTWCCSSTASRWSWRSSRSRTVRCKAAYDENLRDYCDTIPQLFWPNGFVDPVERLARPRSGPPTLRGSFFGDWKMIDAEGTRGVVALETAIRGTCAHDRLLDLVENFVAYMERPGGLVKASPATTRCSASTPRSRTLLRIRSAGDKRLGVFWHTQGSGKSLSMLWFTQKVLRRLPGAWTFVMVTDRTNSTTSSTASSPTPGSISKEAGSTPRTRLTCGSCSRLTTATCSR